MAEVKHQVAYVTATSVISTTPVLVHSITNYGDSIGDICYVNDALAGNTKWRIKSAISTQETHFSLPHGAYLSGLAVSFTSVAAGSNATIVFRKL